MRLPRAVRFRLGNQQYTLRTLDLDDVTEEYVAALRRQREFLTANPTDIQIGWQQAYVQKILESEAETICGLFADRELLATSGMQGIRAGGVPTIGIFVLKPENRGRGLGRALVWSASMLVGHCAGVERVEAGIETRNLASRRSFESCGFAYVCDTRKGFRVGVRLADLKQPDAVSDVAVIAR